MSQSTTQPVQRSAFSSEPNPTFLEPVVLALVCLGLTVVAHLLSPMMGMLFSVLLGLIVGFAYSYVAPAFILLLFVFQNLFIALVSPWIGGDFALIAMRSTNFMLTAVIWAVLLFSILFGRLHRSVQSDEFTYILIVFALVFAFFVFGLVRYGENALIYLRNIVTPLLFLSISLISFRVFRTIDIRFFAMVLLILVTYGYIEFFFGRDFWDLINGDTYQQISFTSAELYPLGPWLEVLNRTGHVTRDLFEEAKVHLFNFAALADFDVRFRRPTGPNLHSISFAYAITALCIALFAWGRGLYVLLALPLLFLIGSKGATVFLFLCLGGVLVARFNRGWVIFYGFIALLAAYATVAFVVAYQLQNFHALGLVAGIENFVRNPIGNGLGASGILSMEFHDIDWDRAQHTGRTDVVVESAVAVLLHQMGALGLAVVGLNIWLAHRCWQLFQRTGLLICAAAAFMVLTITVNGIFQEEALFAPLAQGTVMIFVGLVIGKYGSIHHRRQVGREQYVV